MEVRLRFESAEASLYFSPFSASVRTTLEGKLVVGTTLGHRGNVGLKVKDDENSQHLGATSILLKYAIALSP